MKRFGAGTGSVLGWVAWLLFYCIAAAALGLLGVHTMSDESAIPHLDSQGLKDKKPKDFLVALSSAHRFPPSLR